MPSPPDTPSYLIRARQRFGPWAVVTGASSGIGRAFADALARGGFDLILAARSGDVLRERANTLSAAHGVSIMVVDADLGTNAGLERLEWTAHDLDVGLLVASAGLGTSGGFWETDWERHAQMLAVNGDAVLRSAHHFGRRFVSRGQGGIVLFGSVVGFQGTPNAAHYAATKAYVQTLAEGLYVEGQSLGISVVSVAPGPVSSGFASRSGLRYGPAAQPADMVRPTLEALGKRPTVHPGALAKAMNHGLSLLPRRVRSGVLGRVFGAMIER